MEELLKYSGGMDDTTIGPSPSGSDAGVLAQSPHAGMVKVAGLCHPGARRGARRRTCTSLTTTQEPPMTGFQRGEAIDPGANDSGGIAGRRRHTLPRGTPVRNAAASSREFSPATFPGMRQRDPHRLHCVRTATSSVIRNAAKRRVACYYGSYPAPVNRPAHGEEQTVVRTSFSRSAGAAYRTLVHECPCLALAE